MPEPTPMSDARLAEIRDAFSPASIYASGVAGDGVITMGNELLAEVERLRGALQRAWQLYAEAERDNNEARAGWQAAERRISELKQARTEATP